MPGKRYFATRNDLLPEFRKNENLIDIQYVSCNSSDDINIPTYDHFEDIPLNDQAGFFGTYTMSNSYMIIPKGATYYFSTIHRTDKPGMIYYLVELHENLDYITCTFGGWYKYKQDSVFIGGTVSLYRGATQHAHALYKPFSRNFCNKFITIKDWQGKSWKIGPEALEILRSGTRFITDISPDLSDPSHDLVLPPELK